MYRHLVHNWKCLIKQFNPHHIRWGFLFSSVFGATRLHSYFETVCITLFHICSEHVTQSFTLMRIFTCKKFSSNYGSSDL